MDKLHDFVMNLTDEELSEIAKPLADQGICLFEVTLLEVLSNALHVHDRKNKDRSL